MTEEKVVLAHVNAEINAEDPRSNVMALVDVAKNICEALGKTPAEGAVMLMTAAASILDCGALTKAEDDGEEYDPGHMIPYYMQMAAHGWNLNAMMFRGAEGPELGEVQKIGDDEDEPKRTLQ
jgi:hypothetical protein